MVETPPAGSTQRDRLRARSLPTRVVPLPRDPVAHAAAVDAYTRAMVASSAAGRGPEREATQQQLLDAKAALDAAAADVEVFTLRCLPPSEWEALRAQHPPTAEQQKQGKDWDPAGFRPALLAACVVPPPQEAAYTVADWLEFARDGRVSVGEQDLLVATAVVLNTRAVQLSAGKG